MNMNPPDQVEISRIQRSILFEKPRITKFNIDWDSNVKSVIPSYNNFMFDNMNKSDKVDLFSGSKENKDIEMSESKGK